MCGEAGKQVMMCSVRIPVITMWKMKKGVFNPAYL